MNNSDHIGKRVLALTRYDDKGASSRLRFLQYKSHLEECGFHITVSSLISNESLENKFKAKSYPLLNLFKSYLNRLVVMITSRNYDLIWVEKESLPWFPAWLEILLYQGVPYVLDYDDATFHTYDLHQSSLIRILFRRKIDGLMRKSALVLCGNKYLADRAMLAQALRIQVIPTVINLERYPSKCDSFGATSTSKNTQKIVWIGSPYTVKYLKNIIKPLQQLSKVIDFTFVLIGVSDFVLPGVKTDLISWSEETEVSNICSCDIGIMPLTNTPWEEGKCGYKLIQYMACSLPVVASDVGVNSTIVSHGVNGYIVSPDSPNDWFYYLFDLLKNKQRRHSFGHEGRKVIEEKYCLDVSKEILSTSLGNILI